MYITLKTNQAETYLVRGTPRQTMSKIQVSASIKIPKGMLEDFKQHAAECIKQVKKKDSETLQYDWFLSSDKTECEIREIYKSSEAVLKHQSNIREPLGALFEKFGSPNSLVIYGDPSPELLEYAKASGIDIKIFTYLQGL
jgi:quinol monooxygenase YgiN